MTASNRRTVLQAAAAAAALGLIDPGMRSALAAGEGAAGMKFRAPQPFSFDLLKQTAERMAHEPYAGPAHPSPDILGKIDYEAWGKITFNTDHALFAEGPGRFPISFFHLGMFFQKAVEMHVVSAGQSREIIYDPDMFDMPEDSLARQLPKGAGFAGLRIQEARQESDGTALDWRKNDWVAFLGAAYFRAIGQLHQYGLSSRAIALDVAVAGKPEEFPDFTKFYIDAAETQDGLTIYALLEGPSIAGACKFGLTRGKGVVMDIDQTLFLRRDIARFGIAPLTSMYWFSETKKQTAVDWRPEVHDSDGLAVWTGSGERFWRPLNNPPQITTSSFLDENPRGFGLLQRDRVFDHYLDGAKVLSSSSRSPPMTRFTTMSSPCGCRKSLPRRAVRSISPTACIGWLTSRCRLNWRVASPRGSAMAASPADRGRRACANSWSNFLGNRWPSCPSASSRSRCFGPRAAASLISLPKPCQTTCLAIGGRNSI
jgi:periplasmic glucans biosynthesis protein